MEGKTKERMRGELSCWTDTQYSVLNDAAKYALAFLDELELVHKWLQLIESKSGDIEIKYMTRLARDGAALPEVADAKHNS